MSQQVPRAFDVVIIGAGASGGWAAKRLAEAGVRVALVDAGRPHDEAGTREHTPGFELRYRDLSREILRRTRPRQQECYACTEYNYDWFANDIEEPYTTPDDKPFSWQGRMRITGGRTAVWARQSYRLSDLDFKAASRDGFGEDWPLAYRDLAPYYDLVERYIGVSGQAEGVWELPDGVFLPPMPLTCPETRLRERVKAAFGRSSTPAPTERVLHRAVPERERGPRWPGFLRGYGMQGGWGDGVSFNWSAQGFGAAYKQALHQGVTTMNIGGFGECLPRWENYVEIDRGVVDTFGIPVLRINMTWSDNERAMIPDMAAAAAEMLEAAGATNVRPWTADDRMPGMGIHETGVARMGTEPRTSVLNAFQQAHDVKNLLVMDASGFPSSGCQNPTLTIMALTVRSCDYLLEQMRRGDL